MRSVRLCLLLAVAASVGSADEAPWARGLGSENPRLAQAAVAHFVDQGAAAVPVLREALRSKHILSRQYAAAALARIAQPGADRPLLRTLMTTQDALLQQFCGEALAARGEAVVPLLRRALALDVPPPPDGPLTRADEEAEARRSLAFEVIYDLPPSLALPLCAEYVSRPEGNRNDAAKLLFLDQGAAGMRLWAKSFLSQTGLPDVAAANRAWDAGKNEWEDFMRRWSISHWMHPAPYEIALYDEPEKQETRAMVRQVAEEARQSEAAPQRLWGYYHLAMLTPEDGTMELLREALADSCWMIPVMFLEEHQFGLDDEAYEALAPTLRRLAGSPCKAIRCTAAQIMAEHADPAAPDALAAMLREGSARDHEEVGWIVTEYTHDWTDEQRLRLLEPLLAVNKMKRGPTYVCNALGTMPEAAWPTMAELLQHPWPGTRQGGAEIAGLIGAKASVPLLVRALDDPKAQVRDAALESLAVILHEQAAPYILRVFDGGNPAARGAAYEAALKADDPALVARLILTKPQLVVPPTDVFGPPDDDFGIPVVKETRIGADRGEESETVTTVVPELLAVAQRLFADKHQPVRVRVVAAEAILKASVPSRWSEGPSGPPGDEGPGEPPGKSEGPGGPRAGSKGGPGAREKAATQLTSLPPELWPVLEFALRHFPWGINWGPNETEPIVDAARLVRNPDAVPTLVGILRGAPNHPLGGPSANELGQAIVASLLQIKPEGEAAFWRLVERSNPKIQISLLQQTNGSMEGRPPVSSEKLAEACVRLLRRKPLDPRQLLSVVVLVPPDAGEALQLAREALREAYVHWTPGGPARIDYLRALSRLRDPQVETLYLQLLERRDAGYDRYAAISSLQRLHSHAAFRQALSLANSDFEVYSLRYWALRAVEKRDKALAQQIAARWTRDYRYQMRDAGRLLLAGEPKGYL